MQPVVGEPFAAVRDVVTIPTYWPMPSGAYLPMNAFLLDSAEPVLIDTGAGAVGDAFMAALSSLIPLDRLRWIWLTHEDRDHTGSLSRLLEVASQARVVTDFFSVGRITPEHPFPLDRLRLVTPGERLHVGDRDLVALRPPLYDSPATMGLLDDSTGVLLSSDCFGAPMPSLDEAAVRSVADLDPRLLAIAQKSWATVDSPWVTVADADRFGRSLDEVRKLEPTAILSSHLPPILGQTEQVLANVAAAVGAQRPPATTQAELEALLASLEPVA